MWIFENPDFFWIMLLVNLRTLLGVKDKSCTFFKDMKIRKNWNPTLQTVSITQKGILI